MINIKVLASSSKGNCYRVSDGVTPILLEAGIPIKKIKQGLNFKLHEIEGCLISHSHSDHSKEFFKLIKYGIDTYMSQGTKKALANPKVHNLNVISSQEDFEIGTWIIKPFDVEHDVAEPLGFLLFSKHTKDKLLYLTDTFYTKYTYPKMNYIMIECNHSYKILDENVAAGRLHPAQKKRLIQSHMALENVKDMLKANDLSKVKEIYLIHLSDENSSVKEFKKEIQSLTGKPVYVAQE